MIVSSLHPHHLAEPIVEVVDREARALLQRASTSGTVDAAALTRTWWRIVREITLGPSAVDDSRTTDRLRALRANGNWSYFVPDRSRRRERFTDIAEAGPDGVHPYPYLRAAVLESLRLWPTTPMILRDSTRDTEWDTRQGRFTVPGGTGFAILASGFHRDTDRLRTSVVAGAAPATDIICSSCQ